MPRPRKLETEHRSEHVAFRLSPDELDALDRRAQQAGLSVGAFARECALRGRVTLRQGKGLSPELFTALQRIGVNLNQIARAANEGRGVFVPELATTLEHLNVILSEGVAHGSKGR